MRALEIGIPIHRCKVVKSRPLACLWRISSPFVAKTCWRAYVDVRALIVERTQFPPEALKKGQVFDEMKLFHMKGPSVSLRFPKTRVLFSIVTISAAAAACGGGASLTGSSFGLTPRSRHLISSTPVQHVIVVIQENRSFDNFFATFPGANGA